MLKTIKNKTIFGIIALVFAIQASTGAIEYFQLRSVVFNKFTQGAKTISQSALLDLAERFKLTVGDDKSTDEQLLFNIDMFMGMIQFQQFESILKTNEDLLEIGFINKNRKFVVVSSKNGESVEHYNQNSEGKIEAIPIIEKFVDSHMESAIEDSGKVYLFIPFSFRDQFLGGMFLVFSNRQMAQLPNTLLLTSLGLLAFFTILSTIVMKIFLSKILTRPIEKMIGLMKNLADGKFEQNISVKNDDEIGQLTVAMADMASALKSKVSLAEKISLGDLGVDVELASEEDQLGLALQKMLNSLRTKVALANQIARGNLAVDVVQASENDTLGMALKEMVANLNTLLSKVNFAAQELKQSSATIANVSHNLAQGSNQQAASLEEITSSMEELESQTRSNSENANTANLQATETKKQAEAGNQQMKAMLKAMNEINATSEQISNIIKTIDEIAFQTNVLAINAAVEAARAGEHGKGFAVVAEEVRNLAQRSAQASKETATMITTSIKRINAGAKAADDTAQSLAQISDSTLNVTRLVQDISSSSQEQALGVSQINQGLTQLNYIVQSGTSIAEQSASASKELDNQAIMLSQLVSNFQLANANEFIQENKKADYVPEQRHLPHSDLNAQHVSVKQNSSHHRQEKVIVEESDYTQDEGYVSFEDEDLGRF